MFDKILMMMMMMMVKVVNYCFLAWRLISKKGRSRFPRWIAVIFFKNEWTTRGNRRRIAAKYVLG
jgi:hypothetical protein